MRSALLTKAEIRVIWYIFLSRMRAFVGGSAGSVAIEFALLVVPYILILGAIIELGAKSLLQSDLDRVLTEVTSVLSSRATIAANAGEFIESTVCAIASPMLDCSQIDIGATVVNGRLFDYRNQSLAGIWSLGCGGDTVLIEVTYAYQDFILPFAVADVVSVDGEKRYRARSVIRREPILTGPGACAR